MLKQPTKPLEASQVPLDPSTQTQIQAVRPLSEYKLRFINHQYPVLSLLYAVMAGGENALYCDYTGDFVAQYLFANPDRPTDAEVATATALGEALKEVSAERLKMQNTVPASQKAIVLSSESWDAVWAVLKPELMQFVEDAQKGVVAPPLCMW